MCAHPSMHLNLDILTNFTFKNIVLADFVCSLWFWLQFWQRKNLVLYVNPLRFWGLHKYCRLLHIFILNPGLRLQEEVYLCYDNLPLTGLIPWFCHCECGCSCFLLGESSRHGHQQCRGLQVAGTFSSSLRRFHNKAEVVLLMNMPCKP
jgi:hypothetical protein